MSRCASQYILTLLTNYILALLLCVTKLTIYILLCINARTYITLIDYSLLVPQGLW